MQSRNLGIDLFRFCGALAVVGIHVGNVIIRDLNIDAVVSAITSFAVPYFFIASGFFYKKEKSIKHFFRYLTIYCFALFVYSLIGIGNLHFDGIFSLLYYLASPNIVARHLWFLVALMGGNYSCIYSRKTNYVYCRVSSS